MYLRKSHAQIMRDSMKDARQALAMVIHGELPPASRKMVTRNAYDKIGRALYFLQTAKEDR